MDFQLILIVFSVIFTGGLAINAHLSENKKEKELKSKTEEIIMLQKKLAEKSEETIQKQNDLILEQKENKIISKDILKLQGELDSNTTAISEITKEISKVSTNTNQISNIIKNEQQEKGVLKLEAKDYDSYRLDLGGAAAEVSSTEEIPTRDMKINGIPFSVALFKKKLLLTTQLYDMHGNLLFQIKNGSWSVKKDRIFSLNYDKYGLEIMNNRGHIVLQIELEKNKILVSGVFFLEDSVVLISRGNLENIQYSDKDVNKKINIHLNRIHPNFKHHGEGYLGKRLK